MPPQKKNISGNRFTTFFAASFVGQHEDRLQRKNGECEELYGPYPSSIPIPYMNEKHDTPSEDILDNAKTMFALQSNPDYRDQGTPDEWIPRDGRLIRLTGRHPFNAEPPVSIHYKYKFITPPALHYVRSHGAVPQLTWEDHTLCIGGPSVPRPLELTMDDIAGMEAREIPVTLVCSANRRKEQNTIRQTVGFNWGPCAAATSVWKGARLRDILLQAGVSEKNMAGKHVEFIGAEDLPNKVGPGPFKEDPWGELVKYGTSIPLGRAMSPVFDVIIAYEANSEPLQPDHGFPIRVIIPGYTAGRMVKWLKYINIIDHETTNHYHYHDNRLLPPNINAEESMKGNWFYKPEYIINELNINSTISAPGHDEVLSYSKKNGIVRTTSSTDKSYEVGGYAYTGGGRKITRVEVSLDGGDSWKIAEIDCKERPNDYGMYWCWIWWTFNIQIDDLFDCEEICCRAWDAANNTQPLNPTWNLMGMGNNQVFRVKVHQMDGKDQGEHLFRFEHPTQAGQQTGGWMTTADGKIESAGFGSLVDRVKEKVVVENGDVLAKKISALKESHEKSSTIEKGHHDKRLITMEEVNKHNKNDDVWIVVNKKVYDCTDYLNMHPGGADSILINAGEDCTEDFTAIHSIKATKMLDKYYIGDLLIDGKESQTSAAAAAKQDQGGIGSSLSRLAQMLFTCQRRKAQKTDQEAKEGNDVELLDSRTGHPVALDPKKKLPFELKEKTILSHDSFLLDFALQSPEHILGLPTGKHVFLSADVNGKTVMRRYTPISSNFDIGQVKFVIKAYRPSEKFPEGGKFSQHLDSLEVGDTIDMRGPVGMLEYMCNGKYHINGEEHYSSKLNMIAGGTGIAPVMQVAEDILVHHPEDPTQISLIFACREENDLLMRSTLDEWAARYPEKFKVHYILSDKWPKEWEYSTGYVNEDLFRKELHPPGDDVHTLMCGPPIMMEEGCMPNLLLLGHKKDRIFEF